LKALSSLVDVSVSVIVEDLDMDGLELPALGWNGCIIECSDTASKERMSTFDPAVVKEASESN